MAQNLHHYLTFFFFFITSIFVLCFLDPITCNPNTQTRERSKVKGLFVFGASIVDNGNNNFLATLGMANYLPYGIDFPLGPTGRFTNGENFVDLIGYHLNLPYIPPFKNPLTQGLNITYGVNFASGGSGILDQTGSITGDVLTLNEQIDNFENVTLPELERVLGMRSRESLPKYIFVVSSGANDYQLNYFLQENTTYANVTLEAFTANLTTTFSRQLKRLYKLGARKFVILTINPLGCIPAVLATEPADESGCVERRNRAAQLFNANLILLVNILTPQLSGSTFVVVNTYKIIRDIIRNPAPFGFRNVSGPCCELSSIGILCERGGSTCSDRTEYVHFDGTHPTEAINDVIATEAYSSNLLTQVYPFNIKRLADI